MLLDNAIMQQISRLNRFARLPSACLLCSLRYRLRRGVHLRDLRHRHPHDLLQPPFSWVASVEHTHLYERGMCDIHPRQHLLPPILSRHGGDKRQIPGKRFASLPLFDTTNQDVHLTSPLTVPPQHPKFADRTARPLEPALRSVGRRSHIFWSKSTKTKWILLPCPCGLLATSRPIGTTRQTSENARDVLNFMGRPVVGKLQVWVPILPSMIRVLLFRANGQLRRANPPSETLAAAFDRLSPVSRRFDQSHSLFHICSHGSRDAGRSTKPWLEVHMRCANGYRQETRSMRKCVYRKQT